MRSHTLAQEASDRGDLSDRLTYKVPGDLLSPPVASG